MAGPLSHLDPWWHAPLRVGRPGHKAEHKERALWRHDLRQLTFNKLGKTGVYQPIRRSLAFPFLRPDDVVRFVDQMTEKDENAILREFVVLANILAAKRKP